MLTEFLHDECEDGVGLTAADIEKRKHSTKAIIKKIHHWKNTLRHGDRDASLKLRVNKMMARLKVINAFKPTVNGAPSPAAVAPEAKPVPWFLRGMGWGQAEDKVQTTESEPSLPRPLLSTSRPSSSNSSAVLPFEEISDVTLRAPQEAWLLEEVQDDATLKEDPGSGTEPRSGTGTGGVSIRAAASLDDVPDRWATDAAAGIPKIEGQSQNSFGVGGGGGVGFGSGVSGDDDGDDERSGVVMKPDEVRLLDKGRDQDQDQDQDLDKGRDEDGDGDKTLITLKQNSGSFWGSGALGGGSGVDESPKKKSLWGNLSKKNETTPGESESSELKTSVGGGGGDNDDECPVEATDDDEKEALLAKHIAQSPNPNPNPNSNWRPY